MSDLKVDFGALQTASSDIGNGANQIKSELDNMDSKLQPLRSDWTGGASEAYATAKQQWSSAITDMQELLMQIGQAVSSSHDDFSQTESGNTKLWN